MSAIIYEWLVIKKFADEVGDRICNRVVRYLRTIEVTLSGDDSPLKNAWEEICVQVQFEQSFYWETYEQMVDLAIEEEVTKLPEHELAAMWFQTPDGEEWGFTDGSDREEPIINKQLVVDWIREKVLDKAGGWTNSRIREFLDGYE
jgi:hypothetical protein